MGESESLSVPLWSSEKSMHRWSPQCALGWLQAELEEAEQEAEVRGRGGWGQVNREGNQSCLIGVLSEKPSNDCLQNFLDSAPDNRV